MTVGLGFNVEATVTGAERARERAVRDVVRKLSGVRREPIRRFNQNNVIPDFQNTKLPSA